MSININDLKKELNNYFKDVLNLNANFSQENDETLTVDLSLTNDLICHDLSIVLYVNVHALGQSFIDFYFDVKLDLNNPSVVKALNDFNSECIFLKAYINEGGFLVISNPSVPKCDIDQIVDTVDWTLGYLEEDECLDLLKPLIELRQLNFDFKN